MRASRAIPLIAVAGILAACNTPAPPPPSGAGFGRYSDYQAQREALLTGTPVAPGLAISDERTGTFAGTTTTGQSVSEAEAIAAEARAAVGAPAATPAPVDPNNPVISDEQNFDAVAERRTIESDAERIARQRAVRQEITPEPLPDRPRDTGPNIVAFALATTNAVGERIYERGRTSATRYERACSRYPSPDRAQAEFLENGGPERDRRGVDPDGDGFACAWTPVPFRAARGG